MCRSVQLLLGISLMLILNACKSDPPTTKATEPASAEPVIPDGLPLIVQQADLALRAEPDVNSALLELLPSGTILYDVGEVSKTITSLRWQGKNYRAPWIKVSTPEGQKGWVMAAMAFFDLSPGTQADSLYFLEKYFAAAFNNQLLEALQSYQAALDTVATIEDFIAAFQRLKYLRAQLEQALQNRAPFNDYFWIKEIVPGLVPQRADTPSGFAFYIDYRPWMALARQTAAVFDDKFVELCYAVYPIDSIEYDYPGWFIQTGPNEGHSLLGRGIHRKLLEDIEQLAKATHSFDTELNPLVQMIIDDILFPNITYWESREMIVKELQNIIDSDYQLLSAEVKKGFKQRLKRFEQGAEDQKLDFQSGLR